MTYRTTGEQPTEKRNNWTTYVHLANKRWKFNNRCIPTMNKKLNKIKPITQNNILLKRQPQNYVLYAKNKACHKFSVIHAKFRNVFHVKRLKKHLLPPKTVWVPPLFVTKTKKKTALPPVFLGKTAFATFSCFFNYKSFNEKKRECGKRVFRGGCRTRAIIVRG